MSRSKHIIWEWIILRKFSNIYMLMTLAALFWAGAFIAGKFGLEELNPISLTTLRLSVSVIFIIIINAADKFESLKINKKDIGHFVILALIGVVGYQVLFSTSLKYTTASNASIIVSLSPLITAFLAFLFDYEKLNIQRVGVIILGIIGVIFTITNGSIGIITSLSFNIGDIMMLIAATCLALYSVLAKTIVTKYTSLTITTYTLIISTLMLLPFSIRMGLSQDISKVTLNGWISVSYMAIFPTIIAYLIQQNSIKKIGSSQTEMFRNLVPIFSIALSVVFLGERIRLVNIFSASMIIFAVYMNSKIKTIHKKENSLKKVQ